MQTQTTNERFNHTVVRPLPKTPTTKRPTRKVRKLPKADKVLFWSAAIAPWCLAILLLGVSMPHLADGFMTICHCGPVAGWLLAIAIDSAQVVAKLQLTVAQGYTVGGPSKWTSAGIIGSTSVMSMALNVLAFLSGAQTTTGTVLAWCAGILLPLLVLALGYTGSCFVLAKRCTTKRTTKRRSK